MNSAFSWREVWITAGCLVLAGGLCLLIRVLDDGDIYVSMIYLLAVAVVSRFTDGYWYGIVSGIVAVFCANFVFTYPYFAFNFTISGYPVTFISMLGVSIIISTMTTQLKEQEHVRTLAENERLRGNLLRAVSHDLRTPLTTILGASSAILENDDRLTPQRRTELLSGIQEDAQWLIRMVENLLSVTRIGAGGEARITKTTEAAEEIIADALSKFLKRYPGTRVDVGVPDELLMVPMDAMLIGQVIVNLLENAVQHGLGATHIECMVRRIADNAEFTVADDGCGIPREAREHLFEGYINRASTSASDSKRNMGIGLSVCMAIIVAHGGAMDEYNNSEGGATFRFTLPLEEDCDAGEIHCADS